MTDRQELAHVFAMFCNAMGRKQTERSDEVGTWALNCLKPAGTRLYRVEEICNERGGSRCPFGDRRFKTVEMIRILRFAIATADMPRGVLV